MPPSAIYRIADAGRDASKRLQWPIPDIYFYLAKLFKPGKSGLKQLIAWSLNGPGVQSSATRLAMWVSASST